MKKVIVTKKAVREYIREMMSNPGVGWQSTGDLSTSPANISAVVDPSAAQTDPGNPNFKPNNRKELQSAISCMIDDISDDEASDFYSALKDAKNQRDEEDKDMKDDKKVEEAIRIAVRKMLKEAELPPVKKIPIGVHGGEWNKKHSVRQKQLAKTLNAMKDDEDAEEMTRADAPAAGRGRKNVMQTDIGGASFKEIAKELGYASESGAKQAAEKAMSKVRFASNMDTDELHILTLQAMKDYIDFLKGSGELTGSDVQLMLDHPGIVSELDGFREFFDKYIKRVMKSSESESVSESVVQSNAPGPKCPECGKNMKPSDKKEYEANGGKGYPRICTRCAEEE